MTWLAIGIGNTLRRDDGLGPWLAEQIAAWQLPDVTTCVVHQLTPELATEVAKHDCVLFLDACASDGESRIVEVEPSIAPNRLGHALSPGEVLELTHRFALLRPRAWIVAVPGSDFGFGDGLSAMALQRATAVLDDIGHLLRERTPCMKSN